MKEFIIQSLLSLGTGLAVGGVFALIRLPVPAPNLIGVFGVIGLTVGYVILASILK